VEAVEKSTMTTEQQACEQYFITQTTQQQDGRFVKLPTKMDPKQLGNSRLSAERRLHAIECRLKREPDLKFQYHNFMKEYEELGHMVPVKSRGVAHMLLSTTSSNLQGNKYHNKDSSCV